MTVGMQYANCNKNQIGGRICGMSGDLLPIYRIVAHIEPNLSKFSIKRDLGGGAFRRGLGGFKLNVPFYYAYKHSIVTRSIYEQLDYFITFQWAYFMP